MAHRRRPRRGRGSADAPGGVVFRSALRAARPHRALRRGEPGGLRLRAAPARGRRGSGPALRPRDPEARSRPRHVPAHAASGRRPGHRRPHPPEPGARREPRRRRAAGHAPRRPRRDRHRHGLAPPPRLDPPAPRPRRAHPGPARRRRGAGLPHRRAGAAARGPPGRAGPDGSSGGSRWARLPPGPRAGPPLRALPAAAEAGMPASPRSSAPAQGPRSARTSPPTWSRRSSTSPGHRATAARARRRRPRAGRAAPDEPRRADDHRGHRGAGARPHRHRVAQGSLQPCLRLLHRGEPLQPRPRPRRLRPQADDRRRRALHHPRAEGVRGEGAARRRAHPRARGGDLRRAAGKGGRLRRECSGPPGAAAASTSKRHPGRGLRPLQLRQAPDQRERRAVYVEGATG